MDEGNIRLSGWFLGVMDGGNIRLSGWFLRVMDGGNIRVFEMHDRSSGTFGNCQITAGSFRKTG
jgi:hypothetical protein